MVVYNLLESRILMSWYPGQPESTTQLESLDDGDAFIPNVPVSNVRMVPVDVHFEEVPVDMALHREGTKDYEGQAFCFKANQSYERIYAGTSRFAGMFKYPVDRVMARYRTSRAQNWDSSVSVTASRLRDYEVWFICAESVANPYVNLFGCDDAEEPEEAPPPSYRISYR